MLFSILPSAVRCRLSQILSLRRYAGPSSTNDPSPPSSEVGIETSSGETSIRSSGSTTPDGEYSNALSLGLFDSTNYPPGVVLHQNFQANNVQTQMGAVEDGDIDWKYAHQGLNLLSLAANESSNIQSRSANASFTRQLYLHALTYLLRGLPKDLTVEEQLSIRSSLPPNIVEPLQVQVNGPGASTTVLPTERSLLHKTLASFIVQLFILFQFILPYFTYFLTTVYHYDREHKIVQRAFAQGMETLDQAGKSSLAFGSVVLEMGDGKVGQVAGEVTKWVVDGVAGGVQEGVREIMMIVGTGKALSLMKQ